MVSCCSLTNGTNSFGSFGCNQSYNEQRTKISKYNGCQLFVIIDYIQRHIAVGTECFIRSRVTAILCLHLSSHLSLYLSLSLSSSFCWSSHVRLSL